MPTDTWTTSGLRVWTWGLTSCLFNMFSSSCASSGWLLTSRNVSLRWTPSYLFLGHLVSAQGAKPIASFVEAVEKRPAPTTIKELQVFLGLVNFYRRFLLYLLWLSSYGLSQMLSREAGRLRRSLPGHWRWRSVLQWPRLLLARPRGWVTLTWQRGWPCVWTPLSLTLGLPCTSSLMDTPLGSLWVSFPAN
jgi:hypothetical protein